MDRDAIRPNSSVIIQVSNEPVNSDWCMSVCACHGIDRQTIMYSIAMARDHIAIGWVEFQLMYINALCSASHTYIGETDVITTATR